MGSSYWSGLAPDFASHLVGLVGSNVAENREQTIWQGATATAGEFDGFEVLFAQKHYNQQDMKLQVSLLLLLTL